MAPKLLAKPVTVNGHHPLALTVTWTGISIVVSVMIGLVSLTFSVGSLYAEWQHIQRDHQAFEQRLSAVEQAIKLK